MVADKAQMRRDLEGKLEELRGRLDKGLPQIQDALNRGRPVPNAEAKWIALLRQYERTYDALQQLGGG